MAFQAIEAYTSDARAPGVAVIKSTMQDGSSKPNQHPAGTAAAAQQTAKAPQAPAGPAAVELTPVLKTHAGHYGEGEPVHPDVQSRPAAAAAAGRRPPLPLSTPAAENRYTMAFVNEETSSGWYQFPNQKSNSIHPFCWYYPPGILIGNLDMLVGTSKIAIFKVSQSPQFRHNSGPHQYFYPATHHSH